MTDYKAEQRIAGGGEPSPGTARAELPAAPLITRRGIIGAHTMARPRRMQCYSGECSNVTTRARRMKQRGPKQRPI
jgi:hypothetical protein